MDISSERPYTPDEISTRRTDGPSGEPASPSHSFGPRKSSSVQMPSAFVMKLTPESLRRMRGSSPGHSDAFSQRFAER